MSDSVVTTIFTIVGIVLAINWFSELWDEDGDFHPFAGTVNFLWKLILVISLASFISMYFDDDND